MGHCGYWHCHGDNVATGASIEGSIATCTDIVNNTANSAGFVI